MDIKETRFLYVEDDPLSRQVMQMILESVVKVKQLSIFEDSHDFIARLKALPARPDVILMDIHVQPLDGFDMVAMLRREPEYAATPVVALTASVMADEVEQIRSHRFDGAIAKPVSVTSLPDLLGRVAHGEAVWHVE